VTQVNPPTVFERHTAVGKLAPGSYEAEVHPEWRIVRGANGGHLASILLRAMTVELDDLTQQARTLNVHFARVPKEAPVEIEVNVERKGRTTSNVTARMTQNSKPILVGMSLFGAPQEGPAFEDLSMPEVPRPEDIDAVEDRGDFPFGHRFDFRRALGPQPGDLSEAAEIGVWVRLREQQVADPLVVTQYLDAFAPAVFSKLGQGGGGAGVPTVEMTYYFRSTLPVADAKPSDWYLGVFRSTTAREGYMEEDGWLWKADGTLVGQSRQLALVLGS
jgi:acyl-CoA thioesterase